MPKASLSQGTSSTIRTWRGCRGTRDSPLDQAKDGEREHRPEHRGDRSRRAKAPDRELDHRMDRERNEGREDAGDEEITSEIKEREQRADREDGNRSFGHLERRKRTCHRGESAHWLGPLPRRQSP